MGILVLVSKLFVFLITTVFLISKDNVFDGFQNHGIGVQRVRDAFVMGVWDSYLD